MKAVGGWDICERVNRSVGYVARRNLLIHYWREEGEDEKMMKRGRS